MTGNCYRAAYTLLKLVGIASTFSAVVLVSSLAVCSNAVALDIRYVSTNPFTSDPIPAGGEYLQLTGQIVPGDYARLLNFIRSDPLRFWMSSGITIGSPGGDVQEALKLARFVKGTYRELYVGPPTGPCISACFFIYVSAVMRSTVSGLLAVHRPYLDPNTLRSMTPAEAEASQRKILRQAREYLEDLDVPTNIIDAMFQRASTEVYWLSEQEIDESIGSRPPWFEQLLIARCGLDKSIERAFLQTRNPKYLSHIASVTECATRLTNEPAFKFLTNELSGRQNN